MKISSKSTKKEQQKSHNEKRRIGNLKGGEGEEPEAAAGQASRSSLEFLLNAKRNGSKLGTRGSWMDGGGGGREEIGEAGIE